MEWRRSLLDFADFGVNMWTRSLLSKTLGGLIAAALFVSSGQPAMAGTLSPLYVAGGTGVAFDYYDLANAALFPNSADAGASCVTTTEDCAVEQLYAAVGTGGAQASFLAHAIAGTESSGQPPFNDPVNLPGVWNPAPSGDIDYAAGDAPLSTAQLNTYNTVPLSSGSTALATYGQALVVPVVGVAVALGYNPTNTGLSSGQTLRLSKKSFCGILTGTITNWNDPQLAADNPGVTFNNLAITVVVRSDASGSTFNLSNALNAQCPTFTAVTGGVGLGGSATSAPVWPSTFVGEKGN